MWSRFVNTRGLQGCNIAADLHMEHLNRSCKTAVRALGANLTERAIVRVGQCLGPVVKSLQQFDCITGVPSVYGTHSSARRKKDISILTTELLESQIFSTTPGRKHPSFRTLPRRLFLNLDNNVLVDWMKSRLLQQP